MSASRIPWTNDELLLLLRVRTQNPETGLDEVIEMFNHLNSRKRSIPAIKQKWREVRTLGERHSVVQNLLQEIPAQDARDALTKQLNGRHPIQTLDPKSLQADKHRANHHELANTRNDHE